MSAMAAPCLVHASCVAIGGRGVLIEGPPGSGKSTLALELIDRGAALVGDDALLITAQGGTLRARAHPRVAGRIEVRGLGLLAWPTLAEAPLALAIALDPDAPRHPDAPATRAIAGGALPLVRLLPHAAALALRVELALARRGPGG